MKARVIKENKSNYVIQDDAKEYLATVRGSFFNGSMFPKVGDFVSFIKTAEDKATIEEILPRTSTISRKSIFTNSEQVIVANVDLIFIVMGLDNDFNISRLERYLLLARQSDVQPVVILNKCDQIDNPESFVKQAKEISEKALVHAVSAANGNNMDSLLEYLDSDTTAVLLGSSGAGKSTITNWLLREDKQEVQAVRVDDNQGRHTTTLRQLFTLPNGGYLIDTPGMRELGVHNTKENEGLVFTELEALARQCQFSDCDHEKSEGCAVIKAVNNGEVSERQFKNYLKIQKERLSKESKPTNKTSPDNKQKKSHKGYRKSQKKKRIDEDFD